MTDKKEKKPKWVIQMVDYDELTIDDTHYKLVANYKEGFHLDTFTERYCEILGPYDYIVGDWGYDQLRLKGFYAADNRKAPKELRISAVDDYLLEYCNFGCAYFILERTTGEPAVYYKAKTTKKKNTAKKEVAHINEKKTTNRKKKRKNNREFVIRRKDEENV